jgi:hypothetical protein
LDIFSLLHALVIIFVLWCALIVSHHLCVQGGRLEAATIKHAAPNADKDVSAAVKLVVGFGVGGACLSSQAMPAI